MPAVVDAAAKLVPPGGGMLAELKAKKKAPPLAETARRAPGRTARRAEGRARRAQEAAAAHAPWKKGA